MLYINLWKPYTDTLRIIYLYFHLAVDDSIMNNDVTIDHGIYRIHFGNMFFMKREVDAFGIEENKMIFWRKRKNRFFICFSYFYLRVLAIWFY